MELEVFHGSLTGGIKCFSVCSHFGTREQALMCIAGHKFIGDGANISGDHSGNTPFLYECILTVHENQIVDVDDWGSPYPQAALGAYLRRAPKSTNEYLEGEIEYIAFLDQLRDEPDNNHEWRQEKSLEMLKEKMAKACHKVLRYTNTVEGAFPTRSYMILNPEVVSVKKESLLNWPEIVEAFDLVGRKKFGLSLKEWNDAIERANDTLTQHGYVSLCTKR